MLHNREFGKHLGIVHFYHALVDLAPAVFDAGDVKQDGRMLPKGAPFHIIDEANGGKIHVGLTLILDSGRFCHIGRFGRASDRPVKRHGFRLGGDGPSELGRAQDVRNKGVVVEAPYAVGASGFQCICEDEIADDFQVTATCQYYCKYKEQKKNMGKRKRERTRSSALAWEADRRRSHGRRKRGQGARTAQ